MGPAGGASSLIPAHTRKQGTRHIPLNCPSHGRLLPEWCRRSHAGSNTPRQSLRHRGSTRRGRWQTFEPAPCMSHHRRCFWKSTKTGKSPAKRRRANVSEKGEVARLLPLLFHLADLYQCHTLHLADLVILQQFFSASVFDDHECG